METHYSVTTTASFIISFFLYFFISVSVSDNTLSLKMFHRDSIDPSRSTMTRFDLLAQRLQRDVQRVESYSNFATTQSSDDSNINIPLASMGTREYLVQLGVGTPAQMFYTAIDTASDVSWIQCSPCTNCYDQPDPFFDPSSSSSFSKVDCNSDVCKNIYESSCGRNNSCPYYMTYGDGSSVSGEVLTETLSLGETKITNFSLVCGHENRGTFSGFDGIFGLGRGSPSFPMQTANLYGKKFSYCLNDLIAGQQSTSSSIIFGSSALSEDASYTPMLESRHDLFYHVSMTGISVNGTLVNSTDSSSGDDDGAFVDSGTTATWLPTPAYKALKGAFQAAFNRTTITQKHSIFDTCYDLDITKEVIVPPVLVLHFEGGADMELAPNNVLMYMGNSTYCFAFADSESEMYIIGNYQQQGFRVSFDPDGKKLGFTPRAC